VAAQRAVLSTEPFTADGLRWHFVLINIAESDRDASQNREAPVEYTAEALREILLEVARERAPSAQVGRDHPLRRRTNVVSLG
jgi:hypothetical protein